MASRLQRSIRDTDANNNQLTTKESWTLKGLADLSAAAPDDDVPFLIDGDSAESALPAGLTLATNYGNSDAENVGADINAERLLQLSDEVNRIASMLARLSMDPDGSRRRGEKASDAKVLPVSADTVHAVIRARRLRVSYFPEGLFADPAWDMLLELLHAEVSHFRVPISSLCIAAAVPATTALRWITALVRQGLFIRRPDKHDGRRVFIELAPATSRAMRRYFAEVGKAAVI